ncbi:MAG: hypothetical protein COY38_03815 [Candidatus Aenigmarchaeota archaeon CG_4_10_14_0_8_um_filter_37_24]|nr:hypothetical protein [Candidatus Aenigmarchaeota archaeon]OIN88244.1 MAG: hypothetical protein AUJ50_01395 [Candidatus Aenigmarchaeota archaeon CG1_02_38_14]PIW41187.1 MAG: hypothetical protein COW21_03350 [Candidatus Aenigmarchaeota archaeon CG15_BIG_FIL_POST_REV_8_21_14_020_37_27]PIX50817.1 MAG: hypothetical protein COZ52_02275 [Candidatus Aenigmarchaeota archaeon CG_4_8_14_3_um_filter_37_24]PIY35134.1 MAG: hypothetical protein COZ04_04400 [Candidatus Aenigmarchaeota archaeon CG_4_10_14_3_
MRETFEEKGLGFFDRLGYRLNGIPLFAVEDYNGIVSNYNSGKYETALSEIYELWRRPNSTKLPEFYEVALALIRRLDPEKQIETRDRRVISSPMILLELWGGGHQFARGAEDIYETTMGIAERLPYEKRVRIYDNEFYSSNLLMILWYNDDSIDRIDNFDLRTLDVLKRIPKEKRGETIKALYSIREQREQSVCNERSRTIRDRLEYIQYKLKSMEQDEVVENVKVGDKV